MRSPRVVTRDEKNRRGDLRRSRRDSLEIKKTPTNSKPLPQVRHCEAVQLGGVTVASGSA